MQKSAFWLFVPFGQTKISVLVIALGPVVDYKYEWSILTYPNSVHLYIFARDVDEYFEFYEETTLGKKIRSSLRKIVCS